MVKLLPELILNTSSNVFSRFNPLTSCRQQQINVSETALIATALCLCFSSSKIAWVPIFFRFISLSNTLLSNHPENVNSIVFLCVGGGGEQAKFSFTWLHCVSGLHSRQPTSWLFGALIKRRCFLCTKIYLCETNSSPLLRSLKIFSSSLLSFSVLESITHQGSFVLFPQI